MEAELKKAGQRGATVRTPWENVKEWVMALEKGTHLKGKAGIYSLLMIIFLVYPNMTFGTFQGFCIFDSIIFNVGWVYLQKHLHFKGKWYQVPSLKIT